MEGILPDLLISDKTIYEFKVLNRNINKSTIQTIISKSSNENFFLISFTIEKI